MFIKIQLNHKVLISSVLPTDLGPLQQLWRLLELAKEYFSVKT